jgi:hypothetical protein
MTSQWGGMACGLWGAVLGTHFLVVGFTLAALMLWRRCDRRREVEMAMGGGGGGDERYCGEKKYVFEEE